MGATAAARPMATSRGDTMRNDGGAGPESPRENHRPGPDDSPAPPLPPLNRCLENSPHVNRHACAAAPRVVGLRRADAPQYASYVLRCVLPCSLSFVYHLSGVPFSPVPCLLDE